MKTLYTIYGEKIIPYVYEELYLEAFDKNINIDHWMMLLLKDQKKLMENLVCFSDMGLVQRILLLIDTYQDQNLYALDRENWRKLYKKIKEHGDLSKELICIEKAMQIVLQAHGGKLSDSWMNNLQKGLNDCMSTIKDAVRVLFSFSLTSTHPA